VFIGEILANMIQVSDVAPGPLVYFGFKMNLRGIRAVFNKAIFGRLVNTQ
jgi:hypothetical protein